MTTSLLVFDEAERRRLTRADVSENEAPLAALADSLSHDLAPWLDAPLVIPSQKARLTRVGGRCPVHGTFLDFDPARAHEHLCARCGVAYVGREHDDWWAMGAQLWTAERAVHAAALFVVRGDQRHAAYAARILREYTARYDEWPNANNVLGPTRLFFSTYLESIWLLNLCHALSLLEDRYDAWTESDANNVRANLLTPSATLIASYNEGGSNRQVWNEAAICSAWRLLDRDVEVRQRLDAPYGIRWQIASGLDANGFWYEGENYHLFAHRGLWYGVELLRAMQESMSPALEAKYAAGFIAPFAGLLPDERFPSRRDSQYGSSIRQWRTAEWCELGWARTGNPQIAGVLARIYDGTIPHGDTRRAYSTADAERNTPPTALTRADLSWRALLMVSATVPVADAQPLTSVCLPTQGLAVVRRDLAQTYVALEGGQLGGGHGHPDQLALSIQTADERWLEDPGTGSYVERELHWYRSTMAHAAPFVDGVSQQLVAASLRAFDERDGVSWMMKRLDGIADGVTVDRTVVVADGYVLDVLEWTASSARELSLPVVGDADLVPQEGDHWQSVSAPASGSDDDPWSFCTDISSLAVTGAREFAVRPTFADPRHHSSRTAAVWYAANGDATLTRAIVPAAPGQGTMHRHFLSARDHAGRFVGLWALPQHGNAPERVMHVDLTPHREDVVARITTIDGAVHAHARTAHGWRVERRQADVEQRIDLRLLPTSLSTVNEASEHRVTTAAEINVPLVEDQYTRQDAGTAIPGAGVIELAESQYVRTERTWREAGAPSARLQLACTATAFIVDVLARTGPVKPATESVENPLDNEPVDTNASSVQWYMNALEVQVRSTPTWLVGALHAPVGAGAAQGVRATPIVSAPAVSVFTLPETTWRETADGWAIRLRWARADCPIDNHGEMAFEFVVNDCPPDRERRRGQLALTGGGGFAYLAGARRPADRVVRLKFPLVTAEATLR